MYQFMRIEYAEIASVFDSWSKEGLLQSNFLISISADICRTRDLRDNSYVLTIIRDMAVQDVDETEEGTGEWICEEGIRVHVPVQRSSAHLLYGFW